MTKLNFNKLPYTGTTVAIHKSKGEIEKLLKEIGAEGIQWTETFSPPKIILRVKFPTYVSNMELMVDDNPKHQRQVYRAYYWYFHGLVKFIKFGLIEAFDVFLPYAFVPSLGGTVKDLINPGNLDSNRLLES